MKLRKLTSLLLTTGIMSSISIAQAEVNVYGKIHISGDRVDNGATTDTTISSNSSRIGFKGQDNLENGFTAVWKLENEIDATGENGSLKARNRYVGLQHKFGTVLAGYHDTPFKTLGAKAGIMHDTIGERRGILGAGASSGNKFNIRAKNSVLYISPSIQGVQARLQQSTGDDNSASVDENPVTSASLMYSHDMFYVGVAHEMQDTLDASGTRAVAGAKVAGLAVNVIYETLSSDSNDEWNRDAYGGSVAYKLGDTTLEAQAFMAGDHRDLADTGGMIMGVGVQHKLAKNLDIYALYAAVNNEANSAFVLAGSGHSEKYKPSETGKDLSGFSAGVSYKF